MTGSLLRKKPAIDGVTLLSVLGVGGFVVHLLDEYANHQSAPPTPMLVVLFGSIAAIAFVSDRWRIGIATAMGLFIANGGLFHHITPWLSSRSDPTISSAFAELAGGLLLLAVAASVARRTERWQRPAFIGLVIGVILAIPGAGK